MWVYTVVMHTLLLICAKYLIGVIVLLAGLYWLTLPKKQKIIMVVYGVITAILAYGLAKIGSALFYDTRPFVGTGISPLYPHGADNGFPSDHTLLGATVAMTVYAMSKKWGFVLFALTVVVGGSRVVGHIHRPIDIIGSIVFAIIAGIVAGFVTPKVVERLHKA